MRTFIRHKNSQYTRKLCYRKDDRTMPPIMDALKKFGSPGLRPRLLFPKLLTGFCCDRLYESAYKIRSS